MSWPLPGPPRRHHLGDATGHEPHREHEERSEYREHQIEGNHAGDAGQN